jgi:hypothetical protein
MREMKDLRLVMFKDKPKRFKRTEQPSVRLLKQGEVVLHPARLGNDGTFFFLIKNL